MSITRAIWLICGVVSFVLWGLIAMLVGTLWLIKYLFLEVVDAIIETLDDDASIQGTSR